VHVATFVRRIIVRPLLSSRLMPSDGTCMTDRQTGPTNMHFCAYLIFSIRVVRGCKVWSEYIPLHGKKEILHSRAIAVTAMKFILDPIAISYCHNINHDDERRQHYPKVPHFVCGWRLF
jgi:hypothetical protein